MAKGWAYILRCRDNSYYVGCAIDLVKRMQQHRLGIFDGYTSKRRPVELIWSQEFADLGEAIRTEQRIKKWSRAKKEAFIAGDYERLHALSKSRAAREKMSQGKMDKGH